MIYLASPYSHKEPLVVAHRVGETKKCTAHLWNQGLVIFSPIVYCHEMAKEYKLPTDAVFWRKFNFNILRHCEAMYLLCLEGWRESQGCKMELDFADDVGMPVLLLDENDYRAITR